MKDKQKNKDGFVLMLTIMIISASMTIITLVLQSSFVYQDVIANFREREKVKELALGGLQIALSQITLIDMKNKPQSDNQTLKSGSDDKDKEKPQSIEQRWLSKVLPKINTWQSLKFTNDITGIDGDIDIYLTSENGKVNLNQFIEKSNTKDNKKTENKKTKSNQETENKKGDEKGKKNPKKEKVKENKLKEILNKKLNSDVSNEVKSQYRKLNRLLIDPTEILSNKLSGNINTNSFENSLFMQKSKNTVDNFSNDQNLYNFMDLFTVFGNSYKLNIWLLSKSMLKLLNFGEMKRDDINKYIKQFNPKQENIPKLAKLLYNKNSEDIKEIKKIFSTKFDVEDFSVVIRAKIGDYNAELYAIFQRIQPYPIYNSKSFIFKIKRIYWK